MWGPWLDGDIYFAPLMYKRTGPGLALDGKPKFDVTEFEQAYFDRLRERVRRLDGVLVWQLRNEYHERLTEAHEHLRELNADIAVLKDRYQSFVRARQAAPHSYLGYDDPILRLRERVRAARARVEMLMARQGHLLETVAINELEQRRERLVAYQTKARYAVADSYDRAAKLEATGALR